MTADELRKWADEQINVLIECGIDPKDAEDTLTRVLQKLPEGQDPRTWIPPVGGSEVEITESDIDDARADWYVDVEPKFARLLDAGEYVPEGDSE